MVLELTNDDGLKNHKIYVLILKGIKLNSLDYFWVGIYTTTRADYQEMYCYYIMKCLNNSYFAKGHRYEILLLYLSI